MPPVVKTPAYVSETISKSNERLGKRQLWRVARALRGVPSPATATAVRDALRSLGVFLSDESFAALVTAHANTGGASHSADGGEEEKTVVDVDGLMAALRGSLVPRRAYVVQLVLEKVDPEGSGVVTTRSLNDTFDVLRHPDVVAGVRSETDVLDEFFEALEDPAGSGGQQQHALTTEEFAFYLVGVSFTMAADEEFELFCIRAFCLDKPKRDAAYEEEEMQRLRTSSRHSRQSRMLGEGQKHPLYVSTYEDYGKDKNPVHYQRPTYGLTGKFASKQPPRPKGGATSMNM